MKMKYILDRLLPLGSAYKRQHAIRPHEQPRKAQARMSADDALAVSSTIWSRFNSSELGHHYQQYPDEYADADDEHGNGIYPTEPHCMSSLSFQQPPLRPVCTANLRPECAQIATHLQHAENI